MAGTCSHSTTTTKKFVILYCISVSSAFVASLYFLVPRHVRQTPRNDPGHIRWRLFAVIFVMAFTQAVYPYLFCVDGDGVISRKGVGKYLGWSEWRGHYCELSVLAHSMVLFSAPLLTRSMQVMISISSRRNTKDNRNEGSISRIFQNNYSSKSQFFRDIIVAPFAEEATFRGCMVAPLLSANYSILEVTFFAPLFFGVAHVHHMVVKLQNGVPFTMALISSMVQFSYTYLFGAYSAYAFIRTGSVVAVFLSHAFCNFMGLPDLNFLQQSSKLYRYRVLILASYIIGITGFASTFHFFLGWEDDFGIDVYS